MGLSLHWLLNSAYLSIVGVMDDRGKFIYISEEELNKFAKFIKQRGRVSIAEIVDNSTSIINIVPDQPVSVN